MNKDIFTRDELITKTGVSEDILAEWLREKMIRPAGFADDKTPLFNDETAARVDHVLRLKELGYGHEEIHKIIKKIGLPKSKKNRAKSSELNQYLTVGNLAEMAGVSPRTIKYWEDKGIIEPDMRTEGGFRLYSKVFVYLCKLVQDLQLFGYTLEEIKVVSDYFRDFMAFEERMESFDKKEVSAKLDAMVEAIQTLFAKMKQLREGIERWDSLLKKKKKEILNLKAKNEKRTARPQKPADN
jgi:DNA-binding transcriptional MerR regulator